MHQYFQVILPYFPFEAKSFTITNRSTETSSRKHKDIYPYELNIINCVLLYWYRVCILCGKDINKANNKSWFLDLHLTVENSNVITKIYDKWDDFDIVNFSYLDGDVPESTFYAVCTRIKDFNSGNLLLTSRWAKNMMISPNIKKV